MQKNSWERLLSMGLQAGGAAFILSAGLSHVIRRLLTIGSPGLEVWSAALLWLGLGGLCCLPLVWALKRRFQGTFDPWACREAAVFTLFSAFFWGLGPSLP